ncbi:MAG: ATP-dependent DNA helicase [Tissierellia bacterium]|nr:ATP-dependent DNA helicase [Tissierellia bacterium]
MDKNIIKISVRNLVEFVLRSGDIDNSFMSMARAVEGTRAHQKLQKSYGHEYKAEVSLKHVVEYEQFTILLEGRADGIITYDGKTIIDEIKSTSKELESIEANYNPLHWAQAKIYAYIYGVQNKLDNINIQLTYVNIETEECKKFLKEFTNTEIEEFFYNIINMYIEWSNLTFDWSNIRDSTIKKLDFPFKEYRKGQRELAVAIYTTIEERKKLFAQAPTGIGKTMSTLFPSIKAIGQGLASKVFYLTAKTITREAPKSSMMLLMERGLRAKTLIITAKDKICTNDEVKCNPRDCKAARGHYDRVNDAIMDIFLNEDLMTRELVISYALKHNVCPFEFSLDISLWCDIIICDYNYVFDPQVYLRRFFDIETNDYVFLIDEAHNLVDRSREMFSVEINKAHFLDIKDIFVDKYKGISKQIHKCNKLINTIKKDLEIEEEYYQEEEVTELYYPFKRLVTLMEPWLIEEKNHPEYEGVLDFYFNLNTFLKISDYYDDHYVTSFENYGRDFIIKLYCVDSSYLLKNALMRARASMFFSATLTPLKYHMNLLGGNDNDYYIKLSSPFPKENLLMLIDDKVSTRYKDRQDTYIDLVTDIEKLVRGKRGNYFVFFPSYAYMGKVYEIIIDRNEDLNIILQESNMSERQREDFLQEFNEVDNLVAFAVMGGIFSESIDLIGDRLIGAVIVGVGLPQICFERNIIREYFDKIMGEGFNYAYTYPGMNKVMQAGGRVIRSEDDKGVILLIDDRYRTNIYRKLLPQEWSHYKKIGNPIDLEGLLKEFW